MHPRHPSITPSPRPYPNAADREEAERIVAEDYADVIGSQWFADRRDRLVAYTADGIMMSRMFREHRAEMARRRSLAA